MTMNGQTQEQISLLRDATRIQLERILKESEDEFSFKCKCHQLFPDQIYNIQYGEGRTCKGANVYFNSCTGLGWFEINVEL
jgi:hypothetical protein